jgi:hypothetical protein
MAEIPKIPKDLIFKRLRSKADEGDDYQDYMQAVLRQAKDHPEDYSGARTH